MSEKRLLISETIGFLNEYSPEVLEDIRNRYPLEKERLGYSMGEDIPLNLAVDATLEGMKTILIESQRHDKKFIGNLKHSKNYEITGDIISIVSSSSLFLLIANSWTNFSYVMNSLALLGIILPKITQYFTTSWINVKS